MGFHDDRTYTLFILDGRKIIGDFSLNLLNQAEPNIKDLSLDLVNEGLPKNATNARPWRELPLEAFS